MKKIFTLIFSFGILGSTFAQSQYAFSRVPLPAHSIVVSTGFATIRFNEAYSFTKYARDQQIEQINHRYNDLLKSTVNMRFLNASQKLKLIREIEQERMSRISAVRARFNDSRNKYNDWYYDRNFYRHR